MRKALRDYRHIVWDWNGTLLDDTWLCCTALNHLLTQDGHPTVDPVYYRKIFQFPVIKVYQAIGFTPDEHSFKAMSVRFMNHYESRKQECALHPGASELLRRFQNHGLTQSVLSAYERELLTKTLKEYDLHQFFIKVCGGDDIHAGSKEERAKVHLHDIQRDPDEVLYIGDTAHDAEAAAAMQVDCVLVGHGHQHPERLQGLKVRVVEDFSALLSEL
jgi:phosphoglycolate phosphatase